MSEANDGCGPDSTHTALSMSRTAVHRSTRAAPSGTPSAPGRPRVPRDARVPGERARPRPRGDRPFQCPSILSRSPWVPALRSLTLARPGHERAGARDAQAGAWRTRVVPGKSSGRAPPFPDQLIDRLAPRPCFVRRRWIHSGPPTGLVCPCDHGEVAEWSIAPHSKCGIRATVSGVGIPPSPPLFRSHNILIIIAYFPRCSRMP